MQRLSQPDHDVCYTLYLKTFYFKVYITLTSLFSKENGIIQYLLKVLFTIIFGLVYIALHWNFFHMKSSVEKLTLIYSAGCCCRSAKALQAKSESSKRRAPSSQVLESKASPGSSSIFKQVSKWF